MYGLEALTLSRNNIEKLETYHRQNIRCMLYLPRSVATPAIHLLSGVLPVEAELHIKCLALFRNIIAASDTNIPAKFLKDFITRQLAMKDNKSSSWTVYIKLLLQKYNLPALPDIIDNPPSKAVWVRIIKKSVHQWWTDYFQEAASSMSSLAYVNVKKCNTRTLHASLRNLMCTLTVKKATVKIQLLLKRYPLTTCKTSGPKMRELCPLCHQEPETTEHFILICTKLQKPRIPFLIKIMQLIRIQRVDIQLENIIKAILDVNHLPFPDPQFEKISRDMIFKLHHRRALLLGGEWCSAYKLHVLPLPKKKKSARIGDPLDTERGTQRGMKEKMKAPVTGPKKSAKISPEL